MFTDKKLTSDGSDAAWNSGLCVIFWPLQRKKNITRAADLLHVTQPTLSRQLMDLERELGTILMLRRKKGMTLKSAVAKDVSV